MMHFWDKMPKISVKYPSGELKTQKLAQQSKQSRLTAHSHPKAVKNIQESWFSQ